MPLTNDHWMPLARETYRGPPSGMSWTISSSWQAIVRGIEDGHVRGQPGCQSAAVGNAEDLRWRRRDEADGGLERQRLALADPVAEELARLAGLRELGDVGAGVGQTQHRASDA